MALYKLQQKDLPNLERRLADLKVPGKKEDEVLNVQTFALVQTIPEILGLCTKSLAQRLESSEFKGVIPLFFDRKRAFTYSLLHSLGARTVSGYVLGLEYNLEMAQDRLGRFLSMYAPGRLGDIEGEFKGTIDGKFIHQCLSALFTPKGFNADVDVSSQHHSKSYGHIPLDLPLEVGEAYLKEMVDAILKHEEAYATIAPTLVFLAELDKATVNIDEHIQKNYNRVRTQVDAVNTLLKDLRSSEEALKTNEGIKKFVALHNALGYLIKDVPLDKIKDSELKAYDIFDAHVKPYYNLFFKHGFLIQFFIKQDIQSRCGSLFGEEAKGKYIKEINSRDTLIGASDLISPYNLLEQKQSSPH